MFFNEALQVNGSEIRFEQLIQASIVFLLAILIVISNIIILSTYINYKGPTEVINYYFLSLSAADLLCGMFVVPLSVYPALTGHWIYGPTVCRFMGYLEVTLWSISVFTFMWISVDRYLAVRKPLRYETVQTKTRCQCWMVFTWISSALLCSPPFVGLDEAIFDHKAAVCLLDWHNMKAYSVTLCILVLGPSLISILWNYSYIFSMVKKIRSGEPIHDKEYATALAETFSNPNHILSFVLVFTFWICWTPLICVRLYEMVLGEEITSPTVSFGLVWFGVFHCFLKFLIMFVFSNSFRLALKIFCLTICCQTKGRLQAELIGLDPDD